MRKDSSKAFYQTEEGRLFSKKLQESISARMQDVKKSEESRKHFIARARNANRNIIYRGGRDA